MQTKNRRTILRSRDSDAEVDAICLHVKMFDSRGQEENLQGTKCGSAEQL